MTSKIKILVVIPSLDIGGAEMDLAKLWPLIDRDRFDIVICTLLRRGPLEQRLAVNGMRIVGPFRPTEEAERSASTTKIFPVQNAFDVFGIKSKINRIFPINSLLHAYRLSRPLGKYIRAENFDIVHAMLEGAYLAGGIACILNHRKLVMSRLSLNWYQQIQPSRYSIERDILHPFLAAAIANSHMIVAELVEEGIAPVKTNLLHNGISTEEFKPSLELRAAIRADLDIAPNIFVMSAVANLWTYKGYSDIITALSMAELPAHWVLLIIGRDIDGQLAVLSEQAASLGLSAHIRFLGQRTDVADLLTTADLHITASHTEGLPNNVLEAMSSGLAVVATHVGGIPELVVPGETGLLVPPHQPAELAKAISALAADPQMRVDMGRRGRARVKNCFSLTKAVGTLEALYTKVFAQSR
jgi:glycosyltransferase involved in cell wall biosynthesis